MVFIFKRIICFALAAIFILSGSYLLRVYAQQQNLAEKLIRLHVIANSDSEEDQKKKLTVRDAVLTEVDIITDKTENVRDAEQTIRASLPQIQKAAEIALRAAGDESKVTVTLTKEPYATRYYDTFTLPAGTYLSLRVCIGEAKGHNWWCVVFPSLCEAATTEEFYQSAEAAAFTDEETDEISSGETKYVLKFKSLELLQRLLSKFS